MSEASVISEGESLSDIEALCTDNEDEEIPVKGKGRSRGNIVQSATTPIHNTPFPMLTILDVSWAVSKMRSP